MPHNYQNFNRYKALTLLEMVIALAIVSVLFVVVLPVFTAAGNSWKSRQSSSEAIQNGRVLVDYINRNLLKAAKVIAVSDPGEDQGYIEFEDYTGTIFRCDIAANNYVQFGEIGSQSELAGPVSKLKFTCYAIDDLNTPITDVGKIRLIKVQAVVDNASATGNDKTFYASAYLQKNFDYELALLSSSFKFENSKAKTPALSQIDTNHYLCAYSGKNDDGWATVLIVDTDTWEITKGTSFEFDSKKGKDPALSKIDTTHYLCVYTGDNDDGWATVLTVDTDTWEITKETPFEFDSKKGKDPALSKIDATHYLCVYEGDKDDGCASVLSVDTDSWEITKEDSFEYDSKKGKTPALTQIDTTNYLCAYFGDEDAGMAVVLTVDMGSWTIMKGTSFEYDSHEGKAPALIQVDSGHYLCAYDGGHGKDSHASSIVLAVDTSKNITHGTSVQYDPEQGETPALVQVCPNNYLCAYSGDDDEGWVTELTVNQSTYEITAGTPIQFDSKKGKTPDITCISEGYYLCAYTGDDDEGRAVVIGMEIKP